MLDEIAIGKYQEKLHELLREMALSENTLWANTVSLSQYLERLRNIYSEDFHHQYSKLFDVVNSVFEDDDKDVSVFQENLKTFRNFIDTKIISDKQEAIDTVYEVCDLIERTFVATHT